MPTICMYITPLNLTRILLIKNSNKSMTSLYSNDHFNRPLSDQEALKLAETFINLSFFHQNTV